jgi:hypothetical protein
MVMAPDKRVLYEEQSSSKTKAKEVEVDEPAGITQGPTSDATTSANIAKIVKAVRDSGPKEPKWAWAVQAGLVFLAPIIVAVLGLTKSDSSSVDCVAYVNSMETMIKDFPGREVNLSNLESMYGSRTVKDCGAPTDLLMPTTTRP